MIYTSEIPARKTAEFLALASWSFLAAFATFRNYICLHLRVEPFLFNNILFHAQIWDKNCLNFNSFAIWHLIIQKYDLAFRHAYLKYDLNEKH